MPTTKARYTDRLAIRYPDPPAFLATRLNRLPTLRRNWDYSHAKLIELNAELNALFGKEKGFSVVVAGSYGRMDASEKSDLDFLIVHDGELQNGEEKVNKVREIGAKLSISMPNPEGAFSKPIELSELLGAVGSKEDTLLKTAQRLLILMECRPIFNQSYFRLIVNQILDHYMTLLEDDSSKEPVVLLNDLIRYFREICLNVEFSFWQDESTKWGLRNIKLRHSRVLIYAALLLLILNSSKMSPNKKEYLRKQVEFTPLERIAHVYEDNSDFNFARVTEVYDLFLSKLQDDDVRSQLRELDYADRYSSRYFTELKLNSQFLQSELTRFIIDNRPNWSPLIFEYLIF
jgi:predicted nucleotidyltransferase